MGPAIRVELSRAQQSGLIDYYLTKFPALDLVDRASAIHASTSTNFFYNQALVHDHVVINGRKITPSHFNGVAPNSIVQIIVGGVWHVGEVLTIITHRQPRNLQSTLEERVLHVRLFVATQDVETTMWDP